MINLTNSHRFYKNKTDVSLIENYEKAIADSEPWVIHHRLETHFSDGTPRPIDARLTVAELKALNMYYRRPPEELIFMSKKDHMSLHWKNAIRNDEWYEKIRYAAKHRSEEWHRKQSEAAKRRKFSEETKRKIREDHIGRHWYNNGITTVWTYECPEGFVPGRLNKKEKVN